MELKEIIPSKVTFKLSNVPEPLSLEMLTLDDNVWLAENFPNIEEVFNKSDIKSIMKIVARILDSPSKRYLASIKIVEEDEFGEVVEFGKIPLYEKLLKLALDGEIVDILNAFVEVRKRSNDLIAKVSEAQEKKREVSQIGK